MYHFERVFRGALTGFCVDDASVAFYELAGGGDLVKRGTGHFTARSAFAGSGERRVCVNDAFVCATGGVTDRDDAVVAVDGRFSVTEIDESLGITRVILFELFHGVGDTDAFIARAL